MKDSDPHPMPVEVQRAYREPIDLLELLRSDAYSDQDRLDVRDTLLRSLLEKRGDVWVESGSKEVRVSTRVRSFRKNATRAIAFMSKIEDYGGLEETLPMLASIMQPQWARWWESFEWTQWNHALAWSYASQHVLGRRQLTWLAAQYARTVIENVRAQDRSTCLRAIEAAEAWSRVPSSENLDATDGASEAVLGDVANAAGSARRAAVDAAAGAAYTAAAADAGTAYAAISCASSAANSASTIGPDMTFEDYSAAYARLAEITKRLITPTLVTSASRGLHASGGLRQAAMPGVAGAARGASAVLFARRM